MEEKIEIKTRSQYRLVFEEYAIELKEILSIEKYEELFECAYRKFCEISNLEYEEGESTC
jgi:hypothetical protein